MRLHHYIGYQRLRLEKQDLQLEDITAVHEKLKHSKKFYSSTLEVVSLPRQASIRSHKSINRA